MSWMSVDAASFSNKVKTAVNTDTIARIKSRNGGGSTLVFTNGTELDVRDDYEELVHVLLTAAEKSK